MSTDKIPHLLFASPRKLPKLNEVQGRAVVLDIAFASEAGGSSFENTTLKFIRGLGSRLVAWVDHHDSVHHVHFREDLRFVLSTKAEHGACPEMVTPEIVERAGQVDTIVCHTDFDGLASAAKWIRNGIEPYDGCDADARAIDTRIGSAGPFGIRMDRALRARPKDSALFGLIVRHLVTGLSDASLWLPIQQAASELDVVESRTRDMAHQYMLIDPNLAIVNVTGTPSQYDKTLLLLIGQERAPISVVIDRDVVTFAARFDSSINLLTILGISGGMPTRVSLQRAKCKEALIALGVSPSNIELLGL